MPNAEQATASERTEKAALHQLPVVASASHSVVITTLGAVMKSLSGVMTWPGAVMTSGAGARRSGVDEADGVNLVEAGLRIGFIVTGRLVVPGWCEGREEEKGDEENEEEEEERAERTGERGEAGASAREPLGAAPLLVDASGEAGEPKSSALGGFGGGVIEAARQRGEVAARERGHFMKKENGARKRHV